MSRVTDGVAAVLVIGAMLLGTRALQQRTAGASDTVDRSLPGRPLALSEAEAWRLRDSASLWVGPRDAPVVLAVFSAYSCGYCQAFEEALDGVRRRWPDHVAVAWWHFIPAAHPFVESAHEGAECAAVQGRFLEYNAAVFDRYRSAGALGEQWRAAAAGIEGLDRDSFDVCVGSHRYASRVAASTELGLSLGVDGTPVSFIGRHRLDGAISETLLTELITQELRESGGR